MATLIERLNPAVLWYDLIFIMIIKMRQDLIKLPTNYECVCKPKVFPVWTVRELVLFDAHSVSKARLVIELGVQLCSVIQNPVGYS